MLWQVAGANFGCEKNANVSLAGALHKRLEYGRNIKKSGRSILKKWPEHSGSG